MATTDGDTQSCAICKRAYKAEPAPDGGDNYWVTCVECNVTYQLPRGAPWLTWAAGEPADPDGLRAWIQFQNKAGVKWPEIDAMRFEERFGPGPFASL